jgi:hypothetical protein
LPAEDADTGSRRFDAEHEVGQPVVAVGDHERSVPHLVSVARRLRRGDDAFRYGLDLLLRGLQADLAGLNRQADQTSSAT